MTRKTLKEAIIDAWDALIPLVGLNIIWFVLAAFVVTAIPAFGGLYYAANRIAHGETAGFGTFFEGFKKHFWTSWKWGLFTLLMYSLLLMNVWFYGQFDGIGFLILQSLFASSILIFTCMQIYTYPFLLEQDHPSLKIALKNSFAAFVRFMGRTLAMLFCIIILSAISVFLPPLWILISMSVILYFANWQTLVVIFEIQKAEAEKNVESAVV